MFYIDSSNQRYYLGRAFTYGDYQYTSSAATHDTFVNTLGFTQVIIGGRPDSRFYIVSGPDNNGVYTTTPRDLDELKQEFVKESKLGARQILARTDWLVIRKEENANSIPASVEQFRDNVRTISDDNCTLINACTTVAELEALVKAPKEIRDTSNPGSMITNTDPHLAGYPDEISGYDY